MPDWPGFAIADGTDLNEEGRRFVAEYRGKAVLSTHGRDGYPHTLPLNCFHADGDFFISGRRRSQRLANVRRDPRVTLLLEAGDTMPTYQGLMIQADATLIDDDAEKLAFARAAASERGEPESAWPTSPQPGTLIRLHPRRFISWDNTRSQRG